MLPSQLDDPPSSVLFIPHGGGPLPLLGDKSHHQLLNFLQDIVPALGKPAAICLVSVHWEEAVANLTSGESPSLIYDYYGFPAEALTMAYSYP